MLLSLVLVMFSFGGTELIAVTAGEADNPKKSLPKAIRLVLRRILLFYIGALAVMMIIYPWNKVGMDGSPFVLIFSGLGIPAAAGILNFVVLSAAVSVYNSGAYSNARMLYSLALQGNAPAFFAKLNRHGAPYRGTLFSSFQDTRFRRRLSIGSFAKTRPAPVWAQCRAGRRDPLAFWRRNHYNKTVL